ncbi:MAG TPA: GntR family transcriptional regulator [Pyrinomonadaceae bacterium]|nr:GntR family transcriptional regulator [Pyrinomonadaceae bacterium]
MFITIDETDRRPIYQQVVDEIKALIATGELPQGSSLPPVRQVAADLGVNLNTIAVAYRELKKVGLIKIRHGSGAVVIAQGLPQANEERLQAKLMPALTDLILSGLTRAEVMAIVNNALNTLFRQNLR